MEHTDKAPAFTHLIDLAAFRRRSVLAKVTERFGGKMHRCTVDFFVGKGIGRRYKLTPYMGRTLQGVVERTIVEGRKVFPAGSFTNGFNGQALIIGK